MAMLAIESRPTISNMDDPTVFDISLYRNLFNSVINSGLDEDEAKKIVLFAATNDGVGVVTEKIPGEKDRLGNFIFDVESRIRMQLTPAKHFYTQEKDSQRGEVMMVAPEHKWKGYKKDVLELISNWRRGMDKVGMAKVRSVFFDTENPLKENEYLVWGSPKAETWEGENVMKYNGQYGFLYVGRVVYAEGVKSLEVHDFKNDLDASSYNLLFESLKGEIQTDPLYLNHPLVDKVKATVVRTEEDLINNAIWRKLIQIQQEVTGKQEIFGLPLEAILALQDQQLHERIKKEVAIPVAEWIADGICSNASDEQMQEEVKQRFINPTKKLLQKIKLEKSSNDLIAHPISDILASPKTTNSTTAPVVDEAILARYTGSSGDGCGDWSNGNNLTFSPGVSSFKISVSSVDALSSHFSSCEDCGKSSADRHYHCPDCKKPFTDETNKSVRTAQCSCGFKFGC